MRYIEEIAPECPADLFISLYKKAKKAPAHVIFSKKAIQFFREQADCIVIGSGEIKFTWRRKGTNPELRVIVKKARDGYKLIKLDERDSYKYSGTSQRNDRKTSMYIYTDRDEER